VEQGQAIGSINLKMIAEHDKDATVMVIITDSKEKISGLEYNQDYVLPILGS
jgi:PTS system sucrose-specific IIC component